MGSRLMSLAEAEAMKRGCHAAWLDTFEFQAKAFYERIGYSCFATLPDFPKGSSRYFMWKDLRLADNVAELVWPFAPGQHVARHVIPAKVLAGFHVLVVPRREPPVQPGMTRTLSQIRGQWRNLAGRSDRWRHIGF